MARTMDVSPVRVNADPIDRPAWMSEEAFEHLLSLFPSVGWDWSVTVLEPFTDPAVVARECAKAWNEHEFPEAPLHDGCCTDCLPNPLEEPEANWLQEVDEYLGILKPDPEVLEDWEYELLGLKKPEEPTLSWLNVEPVTVRRHSRTRRYGVTDKQSRRDNARHATQRSDYDSEGNREVRQPKITAARSADYDQELDYQHREELDVRYLGIKRCWWEKFLSAIKKRIRMNRELSWWDHLTLERIGITVDQLKQELGMEPDEEERVDWEHKLLEVRANYRLAAAPRVIHRSTPRGETMSRDDYRELARNGGYRNGRVRLIG